MSGALQMRANEKRANENCASSGIPPMKLFFILCDASGSQKSKMAAYKKNKYSFLSLYIQHICTILTAKYIQSVR